MTSTQRFKAEAVARPASQARLPAENIVRYCYRPFDVRWLYWEPETKLLDGKRSEYFPHVGEDNVWLRRPTATAKRIRPIRSCHRATWRSSI